MRWKWNLLVLGVILLPLIFQRNAIHSTLQDIDEMGWIISTPYYTYAKAGDFHHPDWLAEEALDHPPLLKYVFGVLLDMQGVHIQDHQELRRWKEAFVHGFGKNFFEERLPKIFPFQSLLCIRDVMLIVTAIAAFFFYQICEKLWNKKTAIAALLLLLWNPAFSYYSVQVLSEAWLFLFMVLFTHFLIAWFESATLLRFKSFWKNSFFLSLILGLAMACKFTCVVYVAVFMLVAFWTMLQVNEKMSVFFSFLIISLVTILIFAGLTPSLWFHPVEYFSRIIPFREYLLDLQRLVSFDAFTPWYSRMVSFFGLLWNPNFTVSSFSTLKYMGLIVAVGSILLILTKDIKSFCFELTPQKIFFVVAVISFVLSFMQYMSVRYPRYLYLIWPYLSIFAALGFRKMWNLWHEKEWQKATLACIYLLCFLLGSKAILTSSWYTQLYAIPRLPLAEQNSYLEEEFHRTPQPRIANAVARNALIMRDSPKAKEYILASLKLDSQGIMANQLLLHLHEEEGGLQNFLTSLTQ